MDEIPKPIKWILDAVTWAGIAYLLWNALSSQPRESVSNLPAQDQKVNAQN